MGRRPIDPQKIMIAAVEAANALGFEAVTLAAVAEKLGVKIPSLYNYFDGLTGLRRMLTLWALRELIGQMRLAAVGVAGAEAIRAVGDTYRQFAHTHVGVYPAVLRAHPDDAEINHVAEGFIHLILTILKPYRFENDAALYHSVRVFRSMMHGFVDLERQGGFGMPLALDESFEHLIATYIAGLIHP